jgi:transcriptional regulator with XRE-family HTH domain
MGPQLLKDWIEKCKFATDTEAARALGVNKVYLSRLLNGRRKPSIDGALDIERRTGIPVSAWSRRDFYVSTFCNHAHRLSDGKPIEHECIIIPPEALQAEIGHDYERAKRIIDYAPRRTMRRGVRA